MANSEDGLVKAIRQDAKNLSTNISKEIRGTTSAGQRVVYPAGTFQSGVLLVGIPENQSSVLTSPTFRATVTKLIDTYRVAIRVVPIRNFRK